MEKEEKKLFPWDKWIAHLFAAAFFLLLLGALYTQFCLETERPYSQRSGEIYRGEWFIFKDQKSISEAMIAPIKFKMDDSGYAMVGTRITEKMAKDGAIALASNRSHVFFYVDEELRDEYDTSDTRIFGKYNPVYMNLFRFYPEDAGKTFYVKVLDNGSGICTVDNVYVGTELGIWMHIIAERKVEVAVSFFLLFFSACCIAAGILIQIQRRKGGTIVYIASAVFLISVWSITQSAYRSLVFRNVSMISNMPFIALTLVPVPFLLFINAMQHQRYRSTELPLAGFGIINLAVQFPLHVLGIVDYSKSVYVTFAYLILCIVVMDITMVKDIRVGGLMDYQLVAVGVFFVQVTGVIQIISYIVKFSDHSSAFISVGIIFLFATSLLKTVQDTLNNDRKRIEAENASRMKEEFLAGMSHEIRTPLNAVLGLNDMIVETTKETKTLEYAFDVRSAGKSLLAIINDVLDFSKINTGQVDLIEMEYHVLSLIKDCYNVVNQRAADKKLNLQIINEESMPAMLIGDDARVRQIIINILNNAIKYTEKGSVTFKIGWTGDLLGERDKGILKISVKDTGIGIRGEDRERIYESFTRLEKMKNRKVEGTGLGLAITKRLVDAMDGRISFQSDYGIGTEFFVDIPQKVADASPAGRFYPHTTDQESNLEKLEKDFIGIHALVVDDNDLNRKVVCSMLASMGISSDVASNGDECINMVRNEQYDVIFLDHMMPGKDGVTTLKEMKEKLPDIILGLPVIMLTANVVVGAKEEYQGWGFADYLAKPFKKQELAEILQKYVKHGREEQTD